VNKPRVPLHTVWYFGSCLDPLLRARGLLSRSLARRILHPIDEDYEAKQVVRLVGPLLTRYGGPDNPQDYNYLYNLNYLLEARSSSLRCVAVRVDHEGALLFTFDTPTLVWLVST
jgi:uncharacterized membrane protein